MRAGRGGGREMRGGYGYPIVERRCPLAPGRLLRKGRVDPPFLELVAGMGIASVEMTALYRRCDRPRIVSPASSAGLVRGFRSAKAGRKPKGAKPFRL